jgi:hypothetical protein
VNWSELTGKLVSLIALNVHSRIMLFPVNDELSGSLAKVTG